jgi:hypothetical protein
MLHRDLPTARKRSSAWDLDAVNAATSGSVHMEPTTLEFVSGHAKRIDSVGKASSSSDGEHDLHKAKVTVTAKKTSFEPSPAVSSLHPQHPQPKQQLEQQQEQPQTTRFARLKGSFIRRNNDGKDIGACCSLFWFLSTRIPATQHVYTRTYR